jgi:hypothetical protein
VTVASGSLPVPVKKNGKKPQVTDEMLVDALRLSHGLSSVAAEIVSQIVCEQTGRLFSITGRAVRKRIAASKILQEVVEEERARFVDLAESRLIAAVESGNLTATIFTLKCLGKSRGFVESSAPSASTPGGIPLEPPSITIRFISGKAPGVTLDV